MKVLITGITGQDGSYLAELLLSKRDKCPLRAGKKNDAGSVSGLPPAVWF